MVFQLIKIAVCDDQIDHVHQITKAVRSYFDSRENTDEISIVEFSSAKGLTSWVEHFGATLDILILDIQLENNADGISLAKQYAQKYNQIKTIFITGYIERAAEICEAPFLYFLLKPLSMEKLVRALDKAISTIGEEACSALSLASVGEIHRILPDKITYIESSGRQIIIHFFDGVQSAYYKKISSIVEELPSCFYRCHNSFIVNLNYVYKLESDGFLLRKTEEKIPVPRHKHAVVKAHYMHFLANV